MTWRLLLIYLGLLANVLAFFAKPLFNDSYIFPWDFRYVQLPLISFLAEELHGGKFPLWDPFTYCGDPIFANIQASFFHPLVLAAAWLAAHTSLDSLPMILEWVVALQIVGAGIAAYHLFRNIGAGMPAAFAGAIIFETGGYFVSQTEHIGAVMAVSWMPLAWLSLLKLTRDLTLGWLATLAVSLGMAVLGGFPQATVAVFLSTGMLAILLILHRISRLRLLAIFVSACSLAIGLAAIIFLPTSQVTKYSVAQYRADWLGTGGGLYWQSFVSLVQPDHYHLFELSQFKGPGDISFLYLYGSLAGLALMIYCLITRRDRYTSVMAVMIFFGAFWMLGDQTPVWRLLYPLLPVSVRIGIHPEYTYCNFTLPFAALAALGLDRLRVKNLVRWGIALLIAADLYLVGSGRPLNCTSVLEEPGLTREAFDGSTDLLDTLRKTVNRDFPPARIDTMDASINWAECATLTRVPAANGSSPLGLEAIVRLQMLALTHPGVRWGWYYQVENPDSPVLDIMNVKYLLVSQKAAQALQTRPRYRHVASLAGNELYENLSVLPRYFLTTLVQQARDSDIEQLIRRREVDLHQIALTEAAVPVWPSVRLPGSVRTLAYEPDSLELEVNSYGPSFLVLSEAWYPGWQGTIDGKPAEIYRTDIAFRGMVVPDGTHRIRMEFHPRIFDLSRAISAVTLALIAAMFFFRHKTIFRDPAP
jgi:hypothetical protein